MSSISSQRRAQLCFGYLDNFVLSPNLQPCGVITGIYACRSALEVLPSHDQMCQSSLHRAVPRQLRQIWSKTSTFNPRTAIPVSSTRKSLARTATAQGGSVNSSHAAARTSIAAAVTGMHKW